MGTFCVSGAVILKAGAQVSTTLTDTDYESFISQAEAKIWADIAAAGVNIPTDYASMDTTIRNIFADACSSDAAMSAINYDRSGYFRQEAQDALNLNYARYTDAMKILTDKNKLNNLRSFNS